MSVYNGSLKMFKYFLIEDLGPLLLKLVNLFKLILEMHPELGLNAASPVLYLDPVHLSVVSAL